jgi:hypothetical protein
MTNDLYFSWQSTILVILLDGLPTSELQKLKIDHHTTSCLSHQSTPKCERSATGSFGTVSFRNDECEF